MNKFLKVSTWKSIIRSRVQHNKNKKESWAIARVSICNLCEYNSKNTKPKTKAEKVYRLLNLYDPFCLACGCGIKYKTSEPSSDCGLEEIGLEPKWKSIN